MTEPFQSSHFTTDRLGFPPTLEAELRALSPQVREWLAGAIEDVWESRRRETAGQYLPQLLHHQVGHQLDAIRAILTGKPSRAGRDLG